MTPVTIDHSVLYAIIGFLITALITTVAVFGGLWIRSHDNHRQWAVENITDHSQTIAVLQNESAGIREDLAEIKSALHEHIVMEQKYQTAMVKKLGLQLEG